VLSEDILYLSVRELGERIRGGKLSPVELAESFLARSEALGPKLNAYATITRDLALQQARAAEKDADVVLIDTPPGIPEVAYQAALVADLLLLPCGPSPLDLFALKEALTLALKARAERRSSPPSARRSPRRWSKHRAGRRCSRARQRDGRPIPARPW